MEYDKLKFPGGELHVRIKSHLRQPIFQLTHHIRNSDDLMELLLITDALRRSGQKNIALTLPYVPYARQDRVAVEGEAHSLKVFANLINAQNYTSVTVWDPHSDVVEAVIDRLEIVPQYDIICRNWWDDEGAKGIKGDDPVPTLVCPDAGARKKILKVAENTGADEIIFADKIRDVRTGKITGTTLNVPHDVLMTTDLLIVDDICDGGGTFIELAKKLKAEGFTGKIKLYVTHGIFSKGLQVFDGLIDEIYTANPWQDPANYGTGKTKLTVVQA